ncbi:hypothetical protein MUK42_19975 [Musa troglodytarum]|uniref:Uncharacterized protein n=1 Tax=Musa troglodytarum TaxID=320322 RepID=A0A9E7EIB1_9LILI|nr:hypothetical protein MUK42_19975 [Musa troglodytarum]
MTTRMRMMEAQETQVGRGLLLPRSCSFSCRKLDVVGAGRSRASVPHPLAPGKLQVQGGRPVARTKKPAKASLWCCCSLVPVTQKLPLFGPSLISGDPTDAGKLGRYAFNSAGPPYVDISITIISASTAATPGLSSGSSLALVKVELQAEVFLGRRVLR